MKRLAVLLLVLPVLLSGCGGKDDRLPDVTLQPLRTSGKAVDLGTLKGPAVINLWANWCNPCRKEMPVFEQLHAAHPELKIYGIDTLDTQRDRALAVADQAGVTYPLLHDPDRKVAVASGLPNTILLDADGKVVYRRAIVFKSLDELQALIGQQLPGVL